MGWGNNRAVSEVLGAILLFGIVILALGSYQAFVVPQQNAEIESNHDAQISDEFAEIQPAISNAAASGTTRTTSVTLGTRYPVRVAALNPPAVSGQLGTGVSGDLRVDHGGDRIDACALTDSRPNTTSIRYDANYNELDNTGAFVYENSITYRETDGGILQRNDQQLVDGSTIRLFPLVAESFSTGSSSSEQLRFVPGETGVRTVDVDAGEELDITFPSRIGEDEWNRILGDVDGFDTADDSGSGDTVIVTLSPSSDTTYTVRCTPVGIGSAPEQGVVPNDQPDNNDDASNGINPAGPGSVKLLDVTKDSNEVIKLDFEGIQTDAVFTEVRISFAENFQPNNGADEVEWIENESRDTIVSDLSVGDDFEPLTSNVDIESEDPTSLYLKHDFSGAGQGDWFVIAFVFDNGDRAQYFVSVP